MVPCQDSVHAAHDSQQLPVTVIAACADFPGFNGGGNGATGLGQVQAVIELARSGQAVEFTKPVSQIKRGGLAEFEVAHPR